MKLLKKIIFTLIAIVALCLIAALFVDNKYAVTKTVIIERSSDDVFEYIRLLENQNDYSEWMLKDPNTKKTYIGTDGQVGFISKWSSKKENVGVGEQEIIKIEEGKRIDFKLRFKKPFEAEDDAFMTTEALSDNKTKISWGFKGEMDYPMNLMLLFMDMEEKIGPDLQKGLQTLKVILEKEIQE